MFQLEEKISADLSTASQGKAATNRGSLIQRRDGGDPFGWL
jgi:hypothetical protein